MPDPTPHDDVDPEVARRLAAAFGALATTEIPTSAPRPDAAPRPAVRSAADRRRRWGIAGGSVLVAAAAVVIGLLVGSEVFDARVATTAPPATRSAAPSVTSSPTASTPTSGTPTSSASNAPDPAAVRAAYSAVTNSTRADLVAVPGGYEGADLTGGTTIRFWRSTDGLSWNAGGSSTYPPPSGSGDAATIKAAGLPTGAPHALFVVDDQGSTGDGSGVDVSFSDGPAGFGAVKGGSDGDLRPSGAGVAELGDVGTSYTEDLRDGLLVTVECSNSVALAVCGDPANQITKYWRWSGDAFVLDHRTGPAS